MRKFLLWDHDGVLVDTEKWYFLATKKALMSLGCEFDEATYLNLMTLGRGYWDTPRQRGVSEPDIMRARRERDTLYQEYLLNKEIEIEGVSEVLDELQMTYRMAIVTTARKSDFDVIHQSRQIRRHFEFVITVEDCVKAKPAPDPYLKALARFNASPLEALVIEDSARGLHSASAAGLDCVIIKNKFTAAQDFSGAYSILSSVRELPSFLAGQERRPEPGLC